MSERRKRGVFSMSLGPIPIIFMFIFVFIFICFQLDCFEDNVIAGIILGIAFGSLVFLIASKCVYPILPKKEVVEESRIVAFKEIESGESENYVNFIKTEEGYICNYIAQPGIELCPEQVKTPELSISKGAYEPIVKIHKQILEKSWYSWFLTDYFYPDNCSCLEFFLPEDAAVYGNEEI